MKKLLFWVLALMFIGFGCLQFNDPDWWLWLALYWYAAFLFVRAALEKPVFWLAGVGLGGYLVYFLQLIPYLKPNWWQTEEGREDVGLLILIVGMILLLTIKRTPRVSEKRTPEPK